MDTICTNITDYLLNQTWQIAILFAAVTIACVTIRKKTAHLRYLLWLLIVAKCLVPSLITVSLAILPQQPQPEAVYVPPEPAYVPATTFEYEPIDLPTRPVPAPKEPSILERLSHVTAKTWFSLTWLTGVSLFLIIVLIKAARFNHRLSRQRKPVTAAMQKEIDELLDRLGIHVKSRIWLLDGIGQPFVWGILRGSIYLPANFGQIGSREHRRGILMHEIAHTLRFDAAVNILQTIAQAVFWFHPFVWRANKNIRAEREKCCDETTIARLSAAPRVYSSAIVDTLMAEYQSTQPIPSLAIAGPIKNIEDRIKTIMKPGKKFYNRPTIIAIVTILLLAIAAVPTTIALTHRQAKKIVDLESVVVEGIRANRDKFECGILAWRSKYVNTRYEDPRGNRSGQYELWWDGKKIATKYLRDEVYNIPSGGYRVRKKQGGNSYDGGVLSRKPDFRDDNWLGPNITRWRGLGSQDWLIRQDSKHESISKDWSVVDNNGVKLIRATIRSTDETARGYGGYSIRDYDPAKGYGLVNQESYDPDGSMRHKRTVKLQEVIPDGWFPVEIDSKSFARTDMKVHVHSHYELDLKRCSFNDRAALPDRIFKMSEDKQLKYQEKLQKYLAMELEGLSDVKEAAKADTVKLSAREAIEKLVAAAMAGDIEKAAEYAHPNRLPANQIAHIHEIAKGQNLWIMAVVADDFSAMAVSSVIRGDHDRIGPLVFSLDRVALDGRDNWWVHDIDMETPDGAEVELKQFLEKHPEAEKIPSEKKTDVQVEGEPAPEASTDMSERRTALVASDYKATLPSGVTVELVGVCEHPSEGKKWWWPDGTPREALFDRVSFKPNADFNNYVFSVMLKGVPSSEHRGLIHWHSTGAEYAYTTTAFLDGEFIHRNNILAAGARFPADTDSTDLQIGLATGTWQTIASGKGRGHYKNGDDSIFVNEPFLRGGGPGLSIGVTHTINREDRAFRVVAVDESGKIHYSTEHGSSGSQNLIHIDAVFSKLNRTQLEEYRFQTRPYKWVEFKNVSLKPDFKPDVQVEAKREEKVRKSFYEYATGKMELEPVGIVFGSPVFYWSDIPVLLELAESDKVINGMPASPISSHHQREGIEGMVALWIIEGLRTGQIMVTEAKPQESSSTIPYYHPKYRPLNPMCLRVSAGEDSYTMSSYHPKKRPLNPMYSSVLGGRGETSFTYAFEREKSAQIHQEALSAYQTWWQRVHSLEPVQAAQVNPLVLTDLKWYGHTGKPDVQIEAKEAVDVEMLTISIQVEDEQGNPVAGAVITPDGLRAEKGGGHYFWRADRYGEPPTVITNAQGLAEVAYPKYAGEKLKTGEISFRINHPDFCPDRPFHNIDETNKPVVLKRGATLIVSGYLGSKDNLLTEIYPQIGRGWLYSDSWQQTQEGVFETRQLPPGPHFVRLAYLPEDGIAYFSDAVKFDAEKGETYEFKLQLKPGVRLVGALDETVPRPVRNGRVVAAAHPLNHPHHSKRQKKRFTDPSVDPGYLHWQMWCEVKEDGTFIFESLPHGEVELIVICDGYISKNPPDEENNFFGIAQTWLLKNPVTRAELKMKPTARCEIEILDEQGQPVKAAQVRFSPNIQWHSGGAQIFATPFNWSDLLRAGGKMSSSKWAKISEVADFQATSDAFGIAFVPNLPEGKRHFAVFHPEYQLSAQAGPEHYRRQAEVELSAGQTAKVTVTMQKKGTDFLGTEDLDTRPLSKVSASPKAVSEIPDSAKWTEGKAMMGTIATAIRAWVAEYMIDGSWTDEELTYERLGFLLSDFEANYFSHKNFSWNVAFDKSANKLTFKIKATAGEGITSPATVTLDENGRWEIEKPDVQVEAGIVQPNSSLESEVNESADKYNQMLEPLKKQHQELEKELKTLRDAYDDTEHLTGVHLMVSRAEPEVVAWLRKRYAASGVVRCEMPNQLLMQAETAIWPDSFEVHTARTAAYLKGRDFLQEVIRRDKVRRTKWFQSRKKDMEKVIDSLTDSLTVQVKDTADVEVKFTAADPGDAQTILDELLQLFIRRMTEQAQNELTKKMADLHEEKRKLKRSIQFMEDEKQTLQKDVQETQKPDVQVEGDVRIIHFPQDRSMGTLMVGHMDITDSVWQGQWTKLDQAKGDVQVPVGQDVYLVVDQEASKDITPLANLKPHDIQVIIFAAKGGGSSVNDEALINLSGLTGLRQLGLGSSQINGQGLKHLSKLQSLEMLRVSRTDLTDDAVRHIAKLKSLKILGLDGTLVTDTGISYLNKLKSLEKLTLYRTDITGEGFSNFRGNTSLREVLVNFSEITDDGLAHLANLQSLERLSLYNTGISDKGLVHLKDFKSLRELNLEHTEVTDGGMEYLVDLTTLEELWLPDGVTDKGLAKLNKLTGLKWLKIGYVRLTGKGLKVLENFKQLEYLEFPVGVFDDDLGVLKELTSLKQLWIQNSPITNKGLVNLKPLGSLKELLLCNGNIEVKMEVTCSALYNVNPTLTYLNISDIQLDETRLNSLSRFTHLEELKISGVPLRDDDLANLANLRKLKILFLSSDTVSDGGIAHLENLTSMEDLAPSVPMTDEGLKYFTRMKKLDRLQITNGDFTDEGFKYLEQLKSLSTLRIATANEISLESRERIKKALPFLRTLHVIKKTGVNPRPQPGQTAPSFVCKSLDGKKRQLSDYRGKVVLLHFWATWCSPCVASTPALKEFHKELSRYKDFEMISFSLDDDDFGFRQHIMRNGLSWPQVRLGHQSQIGTDYGVSGVPAYILVDPDGKILISRGFDWNKIEEAVAKELGDRDIIEVPKQKTDVQVEGTVVNRVEGRVVDVAGSPIIGAAVQWFLAGERNKNLYLFDDDPRWGEKNIVLTDAQGRFAFEVSGTEDFGVHVKANGFAQKLMVNLDFHIDAEKFKVIMLLPESKVFGKVVKDGKGIPDARVGAHVFTKKLQEMLSSPWPSITVHTDKNGYYSIDGLPAGELSIGVNSSLANGNLNMAQKKVQLEPGREVELNFGDEPGFVLTGNVVMGEKPLELASVRASQAGTGFTKWGHTDQKGNFRIVGLASGNYRIFTQYQSGFDSKTFQHEPGKWFVDQKTVTVNKDLTINIDLSDNEVNKKKSDVQVEGKDSSINVADKTDEPLDARSQKALKTVREFISALKAQKYEIANTYLLSESEQADDWPESDAIKDLPLLNNIKDFKNVTIPDEPLRIQYGDEETVFQAFLFSSYFISNDGETGKLFFLLGNMAAIHPETYESEHWGIMDLALFDFKLQMPPDLQQELDSKVLKMQQLIPYINSYAKDHEGDLPNNLKQLEDYGLDGYELFGEPEWWLKVGYEGSGKNLNLADPSRIVVAHCSIGERCGFYRWPVLYLDGHIEPWTKLSQQDYEAGLKEISKKPAVQVEGVISYLEVSEVSRFEELLSKPATVNIDRSPDSIWLTLQYAVSTICKTVGVPYQGEKTATPTKVQLPRYTDPINIKDIPARKALEDILKPFLLTYGLDPNGLYLYPSDITVEPGERTKLVRDLFTSYITDRSSIPIAYFSNPFFEMVPRFYWLDIPILLELAVDKTSTSMPQLSISSYIPREDGPAGIVALWLIEGLRRKQVALAWQSATGREATPRLHYHLPIVCEPRIRGSQRLPTTKDLIETHQKILGAYQQWWQTFGSKPSHEAALSDPLANTNISWGKPRYNEADVKKLKEHPAKQTEQTEVKHEVSIESRFILLPQDSQELKDFFEAEGIELPAEAEEDNSITAPADSEEIEEFLEEQESVELETEPQGAPLLDPDQVKSLLELTRINPKSKLLTHPKVLLLDGESATISIMQQVAYISGYAESDSAPEPQPKIETIVKGVTLEVVPKITDEQNIKLDLDIELTGIAGYEERTYKDKSYNVPNVKVTKIVSKALIPDAGTLLLAGNTINSAILDSDDESGADETIKELLILITPTINSLRTLLTEWFEVSRTMLNSSNWEYREKFKEFFGLDLRNTPSTSDSASLPDIFEAHPPGSGSYHLRKDVIQMSSAGVGIFYIPKKNVFYVQCDPVVSSRKTYFGPFDGDPQWVLRPPFQ